MTHPKAESMDSANETITIIPKKSKMVKKVQSRSFKLLEFIIKDAEPADDL